MKHPVLFRIVPQDTEAVSWELHNISIKSNITLFIKKCTPGGDSINVAGKKDRYFGLWLWRLSCLKHTDCVRVFFFLCFCLFTQKQRGRQEKRGHKENRHCAFGLSSFPCRLAFSSVCSSYTCSAGCQCQSHAEGRLQRAQAGIDWASATHCGYKPIQRRQNREWYEGRLLGCRFMFVIQQGSNSYCCRGGDMQPVDLMQRCVNAS